MSSTIETQKKEAKAMQVELAKVTFDKEAFEEDAETRMVKFGILIMSGYKAIKKFADALEGNIHSFRIIQVKEINVVICGDKGNERNRVSLHRLQEKMDNLLEENKRLKAKQTELQSESESLSQRLAEMEQRSATSEAAQQSAESELALLKEKSEGTIADLRKRLDDYVSVSYVDRLKCQLRLRQLPTPDRGHSYYLPSIASLSENSKW